MAVNNVKTDHVHYVRTNVDDDRVKVYYNPDTNNIFVGHDEDGDGNRTDIQASQGIGVYLHTKVDGVWTTTPQAISIGGTGGTNRQTALQNLGICFSNGSGWSMATGTALNGYITSTSTELYFDVETPRWMDYTSKITINSFSGVLRGDKGYLDSNNTARNFKASPFTCYATRLSYNRMRLRIVRSSAFSNVTNNTPVSCNATFNFTFNT